MKRVEGERGECNDCSYWTAHRSNPDRGECGLLRPDTTTVRPTKHARRRGLGMIPVIGSFSTSVVTDRTGPCEAIIPRGYRGAVKWGFLQRKDT